MFGLRSALGCVSLYAAISVFAFSLFKSFAPVPVPDNALDALAVPKTKDRATKDVRVATPRNKTGAFHILTDARLGPSAINQTLWNQSVLGGSLSFAVFLQVGYDDLWDDMLMCATNVALAAKMMGQNQKVDFYMARILLPNADLQLSTDQMEAELRKLPNLGKVHVKEYPNRGADVLPFIQSLDIAKTDHYDVILKIHTKKDAVWRERSIESLCGTAEQVVSILKQFHKNPQLDMIAPLGTTFGPNTNVADIFPHIVRKYGSSQRRGKKYAFPKTAFTRGPVRTMNEIHRRMFPNAAEIARDDMILQAGTMFWIRHSALHADELVHAANGLSFSESYVEDGATEHALERLFATHIVLKKRGIAQIPPAPRPVAMYFPQYHPIPENDRIWGPGFTEWTLLRPLEGLERLRKPLPVEAGGLGYYDLMARETRQRQAELARSAGLSGFIYYHYWFSGAQAPADHLVMQQVTEQMLLDGEPDLPFAFSWANEPWTKKWNGAGGKVLLSQEYGTEEEWRRHFEYLLRFFRHPNYIRIDGKPVFVIYRIGHFQSKLEPMAKLWRELAIENGLPGIHLVNTIGWFRKKDRETKAIESAVNMDAAFHFWPAMKKYTGPYSSSIADLSMDGLHNTYPTQYWGAYTGFDNRPRRKTKPTIHWVSVPEFKNALDCSFEGMAGYINREVGKNLYFITAWNEWNEQAILEPDGDYEFGYLQSLKSALSELPITVVSPLEARDENSLQRQAFLEKCFLGSKEELADLRANAAQI